MDYDEYYRIIFNTWTRPSMYNDTDSYHYCNRYMTCYDCATIVHVCDHVCPKAKWCSLCEVRKSSDHKHTEDKSIDWLYFMAKIK